MNGLSSCPPYFINTNVKPGEYRLVCLVARNISTIVPIHPPKSFTAFGFLGHGGGLHYAGKPQPNAPPSSLSPSLIRPLGNDEEAEEGKEGDDLNFDKLSPENDKAALVRRQNARSLALLSMATSAKITEASDSYEEVALSTSEEKKLQLALEENISRRPKFPGRVDSIRAPNLDEFFREAKGGSAWEKKMLRQALSIRRLKTEEVLKEVMRASKLSETYSKNLISHMPEFVDYILIQAASLRNKSDFATSTFHSRAKLCIQQTRAVELIKWLRHNHLTYPRIGKLLCTVSDDLGALQLRIKWLKSIHVRGRNLGVVLSREEGILRRPIEDLDGLVKFLENKGVKSDWMGFIVSRCPKILSFSMEELKCRVNFFLDLGMSDKDFGTMVFEYPKVIGSFSIEDMTNKVKYLKEFGLSATDLGRVIAVRPQILANSIEEGWKPLVKYLYYLGVQRSGMRRLLADQPSIFCLSLSDSIAPKVRFLRAIGVQEEAIGGVLVKFPSYLTYSLYKKIRPVVKFLLERAGVSEADIGKVIAMEPELIGCSITGKLEVTTKYFLALGIPPRVLGKMIADFPMLLKYNVSVIRPKYRYLKRVMVRPLQDIIEFPRFFSYSLDSRIIPRHKMLVENGVTFKLRYMLASSDEEFTQRVQVALERNLRREVIDDDIPDTCSDYHLQSSKDSYDTESLEEDKC